MAPRARLNTEGCYVVGCTFFATLYREDPRGLRYDAYEVAGEKLAGIIQDAVWSVVSTNELAGIAKPKNSP